MRFRGILSLYSWRFPVVVVYMLQSTEYQIGPYLKWFWETNDFSRVMYRRTLVRTRSARLLLVALRLWMAAQILFGLLLIMRWAQGDLYTGLAFGWALLISYPVVWAHLVILPLLLGRELIAKPQHRRVIRASKSIFAAFTGPKIAVAGSYGKTSMKELLLTVLSEGKKVAATPANKNVAISQAYFAHRLKGDEEILIIEYGEGGPGDVAGFAQVTQPTHAIITGIAPAHLDLYKTLDAAAQDIFSVSKVVPPEQVYINAESPDALPYVHAGQQLYSEKHALGWNITDVKLDITGTRFTMHKGTEKMALHSGLLGRHQVGPLALTAALAREFGLTAAQVRTGIGKTMPYEHRMQPYAIHGAWVIDDTYNGNIEGMRAGLHLLTELKAKRKWYITPGIVDQREKSNAVHQELGKLIAAAHPDIVVLMQHSVTSAIQQGLEAGGYKGEIRIENDPLDFYQNVQLLVANGDLVLMQNDWPDNYR